MWSNWEIAPYAPAAPSESSCARRSSRGTMGIAVAVDREIVDPLRIEKRERALFEQHRDRCAASGDDAKRRDDADAAPVFNGHSASRIEDVAIAASVDFEMALVIAAGCHGAVDDVEDR